MTRLEFITSNEYIAVNVEGIIRSKNSIREMRLAMEAFIKLLRDELLEGQGKSPKPTGDCGAPTQITFWPNGGVSVRDKDGETIDNLQGKGWMELYFERLESLGLDPTTIQFQGFINGAWTNIQPIRTPEHGWSMSFSKAVL